MTRKSLLWVIILGFILASCQTGEPTMVGKTESQAGTPPAIPTPTDELGEPGTLEPTQPPEASPTPTLPPFEPVIALEPIAAGLTAPVDLDAPDDGSGRLFITDQIGLIRVIDQDHTLLETPFLDLQNQLVNLRTNYDERGLLGMALHPNFAENGRFFVYYSAPRRPEAPAGWDHTSILAEFRASPVNANTAEPNSQKVILEIDQPQSNHNSGAIAFGPYGYLYIPLGDGGGANDVGSGHIEDWYQANAGGNGQDLEATMLGSVLRIDIDRGEPYAVPEDNPPLSRNFPEIWAYGFRNPYRMAFDPGGNQDLFLADAGQNLWEEVSIVVGGGNYGWNVREGAHCFSTADPKNPTAITDCPTVDPLGNPLIDPILEFRNSSHPEGGLGTSIIGGAVYRGDSLPAWNGRYIFGQWSTSFAAPQGGLFAASPPEESGGGLWDFTAVEIVRREGNRLNEYVLAFGQDPLGEIYVLTSLRAGPDGNTGSVYRIIPPE